MASKVIISFEVDNAGAVKNIQQVKRELGEVPQSTAAASTGFANLKASLIAVGAAFAAFRGFREVKEFLEGSIREAAAEQEVFTRLAATLDTLGMRYGAVSGELQGLFAELQAVTRFGDDQTAAAFQKLLVVTGDYDSALKLLRPTLDLAVGGQMDLGTAADLAGKAATGYIGLLARYGIVLDDVTQKQIQQADAAEKAEIIARVLNERFGGQATADLNSYAGQVAQLSNYWGDLKEAIGGSLLNIVQTREGTSLLVGVLKDLKAAVLDIATGWALIFNVDWGQMLAQTFTSLRVNLNAQLLLMKRDIIEFTKGLPKFLGGGTGPDMDEIPGFVSRIAKAFEDAGKTMDTFWDEGAIGAIEFRARVENLISSVSGGGAVGGGDGGGGLAGAFRDLGSEIAVLEVKVEQAFQRAAWKIEDYNNDVVDQILERRGDLEEAIPEVGDMMVVPAFQEIADAASDVLLTSFSDLLGKGFVGELETFADFWDEIWKDLAKSMAGIIGDALSAVFKGEGTFGDLFAQLKGNWAAGIAGLGMMIQANQTGGGGWGGALMGAMGGAMAGAMFGPIGAAVGAVIGGVIGALGRAAENPETFVHNLGLDTGMIDTRGHQGYTQELRDLWLKTQQSIMRSYLQSYRTLLSQFGDKSLFELIGMMPTYSTTGWTGMGADQLAKWLEQEYWPSAFMNMFRDAISAGLSGLGVTTGTLDQLWRELEALPGAERMGALTTYVSSLVDMSQLMADMDWNAILDAVGMDSLETFMSGFDQIADSIETLMFAMDDMTLLERAEQAADIEELIFQIRQGEIQYLRQLDGLQKGINQSIDKQIEQLYVGGLTPGGQRGYYQQRIQEIMGLLSGGGVTSPEQLQQLMSDLQGYVSAMASGLGDQLYQPIAPWGGTTWAEYLSGILETARGYSDAYFEQFRDEIKTANDELIETLRDLIDALINFSGEVIPQGEDMAPSEGQQATPEINIYLEGSLAALRPYIRAEIRDAMNTEGYPVS